MNYLKCNIIIIYWLCGVTLPYSCADVLRADIADTVAGDQPGMVVRKLQQCCVVFNFDDPLADVKSKEVKRACLNELIAALNDTRGLLTEAVCMEVVHMVSVAATGLFAFFAEIYITSDNFFWYF